MFTLVICLRSSCASGHEQLGRMRRDTTSTSKAVRPNSETHDLRISAIKQSLPIMTHVQVAKLKLKLRMPFGSPGLLASDTHNLFLDNLKSFGMPAPMPKCCC